MEDKNSNLNNIISKYLDMGVQPGEISKKFPSIPYETIFLIYKEKIEKENFNLVTAKKRYIKERNLKIKKLFLNGVSIEEIAKSFDITTSYVSTIIKQQRASLAQTTSSKNIDDNISKQIINLSQDRDKKIKKLLMNGYSFEEIANSLCLTVLYVKNKFNKMRQEGIIDETDIQKIYSAKERKNNTNLNKTFSKTQNDDISR